MPVKTQIIDGKGSGKRAEVGTRGFLQVAVREGDPPPQGEVNRFRFFSQLVSSAGDGTGTTNMGVDGTTAQKFTVDSHKDYDIRIMKILIYIEDGTVSHKTFGAIASLTNGIDISVFEAGVETFLVKAGKDFADLIEQTLAERPWGDGATAFELIDVVSNDDAQVLPMDIGSLVPGGLRIGRGTNDKLQVKVSDNISALTAFTVRVVGYRHYP